MVHHKADMSYFGDIKPGADACYASFPGKYLSGWDALISDASTHGESVACVFLRTAKEGFGQHHPDDLPAIEGDASTGQCYCHRIYGHQSPERLGYLKVLKKTCCKEKEEEEREKARAQNVVVVREDASFEEKDQAEKLAREKWEKAGKVATWGCQWFHIWKQRVTEAVEKGQSLIVVFFPGQVGEGKETFLGLPNADLWNGIGLGGSQKGEIAFLDWMKEKEGPRWGYTQVDVALFLKKEFKKGAEVDAFDGKQWHRGTLLSRPETISSKPEQTEWLKWEVLLTNGKTLMTDRVRHTADGTIQKLCEAVSTDKFLQIVRRTLPDHMKVGDCEPVVLPNCTASLAVRIQIKNIEDMQHLRNRVLSGNFEVDFNHHLRRDHGSVQIRVDKTFFCKHYEEKLFSLADLTKHQKAKLQQVKLHKNVHIRAVAGAGKTFIAVQHMLETLQRHASGTVLFIAPSPELCLFVIRWLIRKLSLAGLVGRLEGFMGRMNVMYKPYKSLMSVGVDNGRLVFTTLRNSTSVAMFLLAVVDEAHDIYRPDVDHAFLESVQARQYLLLSSLSQASSINQSFPQMQEVKLTEVVRSTKRIVAGSAAFHPSDAEKQDVTSLCPDGPPLKTFIFDPSDVSTGYVQKTMNAILYLGQAYIGLNLHSRLALLVPDEHFLQWFQPALGEALETHFPNHHFQLVSFKESLCILPDGIVREAELHKAATEILVIDTIENAKGLEQLIVISIGLDSEIDDTEKDLVTRAKIYQGITRAQLQAIVVNEFVPGGWLAFLGALKFKEEKFVESEANRETTTHAAAKIVTQKKESEDVDSQKREPEVVDLRQSGSDLEVGRFSKPSLPTSNAATAGAKEDAKVAVLMSSVWDTAGNTIDIPNKLQFDPRLDAGEHLRREWIYSRRLEFEESLEFQNAVASGLRNLSFGIGQDGSSQYSREVHRLFLEWLPKEDREFLVASEGLGDHQKARDWIGPIEWFS